MRWKPDALAKAIFPFPPTPTMQRTPEPEILDSLPPDPPDALHNRRDLRLTNRILGTHRWLGQTVPAMLRPAETALEIGAGTGELARALAQRGIASDGLDLWPRPAAWPPARTWHVADLRTFPAYDRYALVFGNLIFHQFGDAELAALGACLRPSVRVIVACEPARRRLSQLLYRTVGRLLSANHVSLHDAHVSIAAGFRDDEPPCALGLAASDWEIRCTTTWMGVYRMIAVARTTGSRSNVGRGQVARAPLQR